MKINLYLDDIKGRPNEDGVWVDDGGGCIVDPITWVVVRTVKECIAKLKEGNVGILSLDHALEYTDCGNTGFMVLDWLNNKIENMITDVIPDDIRCHSEHWTHRAEMQKLADLIVAKRDALKAQKAREADGAHK